MINFSMKIITYLVVGGLLVGSEFIESKKDEINNRNKT